MRLECQSMVSGKIEKRIGGNVGRCLEFNQEAADGRCWNSRWKKAVKSLHKAFDLTQCV